MYQSLGRGEPAGSGLNWVSVQSARLLCAPACTRTLCTGQGGGGGRHGALGWACARACMHELEQVRVHVATAWVRDVCSSGRPGPARGGGVPLVLVHVYVACSCHLVPDPIVCGLSLTCRPAGNYQQNSGAAAHAASKAQSMRRNSVAITTDLSDAVGQELLLAISSSRVFRQYQIPERWPNRRRHRPNRLLSPE